MKLLWIVKRFAMSGKTHPSVSFWHQFPHLIPTSVQFPLYIVVHLIHSDSFWFTSGLLALLALAVYLCLPFDGRQCQAVQGLWRHVETHPWISCWKPVAEKPHSPGQLLGVPFRSNVLYTQRYNHIWYIGKLDEIDVIYLSIIYHEFHPIFLYIIGSGHFRLIPGICLFQEVFLQRWPQVRRSRPRIAPRVATPTVTTTVLRPQLEDLLPFASAWWTQWWVDDVGYVLVIIHITYIYIYT